MYYRSNYTGREIDEGISKANDNTDKIKILFNFMKNPLDTNQNIKDILVDLNERVQYFEDTYSRVKNKTLILGKDADASIEGTTLIFGPATSFGISNHILYTSGVPNYDDNSSFKTILNDDGTFTLIISSSLATVVKEDDGTFNLML